MKIKHFSLVSFPRAEILGNAIKIARLKKSTSLKKNSTHMDKIIKEMINIDDEKMDEMKTHKSNDVFCADDGYERKRKVSNSDDEETSTETETNVPNKYFQHNTRKAIKSKKQTKPTYSKRMPSSALRVTTSDANMVNNDRSLDTSLNFPLRVSTPLLE